MVGDILFFTSTNSSILYGSIFLQTIGTFASALAVGTQNVNNVQPHYKRSIAAWLGLAMAKFRGVLSTWIFNDPPRFRKATKINLAFTIGVCMLAAVNRVWLVVRNRRKEGAGRQDPGARGGKGGVKNQKRHKEDALEMITRTLSIHYDGSCST